MSIKVHIDGQPAESLPNFLRLLDDLGPVPDESERDIEVWTIPPGREASGQAVWLSAGSSASTASWLNRGGAVLDYSFDSGASLDSLVRRGSTVRVRSQLQAALDPCVLAAFLAHDFPLIDAWMLARAYRGQGWPNRLEDYPVPVGGPSSSAAFATFPCHAGLYAVVPTCEWVRRLVDAGVPVVQLRDKSTASARCSAEIREAIEAARGTKTLLFINDDWQSAVEHGAYGVHLGQEDIETADLHALCKAGLRLGISTHGIYEMLRAHACKPSYMALGAIYATTTKEMPTAPQGLRRLKHYVRLMSPHYPLVAIGGIDGSRIQDIWETGVDCAAVLRAIVDAADYRNAAAELLATTPQAVLPAGK